MSADELTKMQSKSKSKEADEISFTTPALGDIALSEWKLDTVMAVAAASTDPELATKWMMKVDSAKSLDELQDPPAFTQLGLKLAKAVQKIVPEDIRREFQVDSPMADRCCGYFIALSGYQTQITCTSFSI